MHSWSVSGPVESALCQQQHMMLLPQALAGLHVRRCGVYDLKSANIRVLVAPDGEL